MEAEIGRWKEEDGLPRRTWISSVSLISNFQSNTKLLSKDHGNFIWHVGHCKGLSYLRAFVAAGPYFPLFYPLCSFLHVPIQRIPWKNGRQKSVGLPED